MIWKREAVDIPGTKRCNAGLGLTPIPCNLKDCGPSGGFCYCKIRVKNSAVSRGHFVRGIVPGKQFWTLLISELLFEPFGFNVE